MKKSLRVGKVLVDWSQNDDHKTTICVYSLRAKERPTVSTPVTWDEVENCLAKGDLDLLVFDSAQVLERVKKHGDLFAPVPKLKQKLPSVEALDGLDSSVAHTIKPTKRAASSKERTTVAKKKSAAKRVSRQDEAQHRISRQAKESIGGRHSSIPLIPAAGMTRPAANWINNHLAIATASLLPTAAADHAPAMPQLIADSAG